MRDVTDRTVELIGRSTAFFDHGESFGYHICPCGSNSVFNGLIRYLRDWCGGNPHDKGLISATGTPHDASVHYQPQNAADLETASFFHSRDYPGEWMCYDFKDMRVAVTSYILRSSGYPRDTWHLKSWVIEGSEDSAKWVELDRRENDETLNGAKSVGKFEVRNVIESRFIRLRGTGPTSNGHSVVLFEAFDVFGGLRVPLPLMSSVVVKTA
jgi:hypothetical protein